MSDENNLNEVEFNTTLIAASIKGTMKAAGAGSRDLWQVEPSKIHVIPGLNPRVMTEAYKAHIRALVAIELQAKVKPLETIESSATARLCDDLGVNPGNKLD